MARYPHVVAALHRCFTISYITHVQELKRKYFKNGGKRGKLSDESSFIYVVSMRQPPRNTARLPKADQWHHAKHSTELGINSYVSRIISIITQVIIETRALPLAENGVIFR